MRRCIFSYANFQIEKEVLSHQQAVIEKFIYTPSIQVCHYHFLNYNAPDGVVFPDQVIDYAFHELFFNKNYDTILMLDVDCIPLSARALEYTFWEAEVNRKLIGNVQRSNHLENDQHLYVAPSCMCITKDVFMQMGVPLFAPTNRGDIGEELTYIADKKNIPVETFLPSCYETLPCDSDNPWDLTDELPKYGIGTTFVNFLGEEMFYHLFQCRTGVFNHLFYDKCKNVLS